MRLLKSHSGKVVILLMFIFSLTTYEKLEKVVSEERTCVCLSDGFGYYMYLPYFFQNGDLKISPEWALELQKEKCNQTYLHQLKKRENGNYLDIYQMGLSMIMLPSYTAAEITARIGNYETDGFSKPYHIAYHLNILLFIFLGLIYLRKLLLFFAKDKHVAIGMAILYLGSNIYVTFVHQYDLPHLFLFALNAISLYHIFNYRENGKKKSLWYAALIFGLTVCTRPTQAIFGIIPFIVLLKKHSISWKTVKYTAYFPLCALIANLPQFYYWYAVGGELITPNLHSEDIVLTDPNLINFLFSYRKGWLLYSPIFLLLPFGFYKLYKSQKELFWAFLSFTLIYTYVMSSWECWWYASSFGSRVMVDIYPIFAIVIIVLIGSISKLSSKIALLSFSIGCIALNLFQSRQLELGLMHSKNMTKKHYWYIFGQLEIEKYHGRFLLIEKGNTNWMNDLEKHPQEGLEVKTKKILDLKHAYKSHPKDFTIIKKINILDLVPTHETLMEVSFKCKTSDSTQSSRLQFEAISKYNTYSWDGLEISLDNKTDEFTEYTFQFNIPWIRHKNDQLQIFVANVNDTEIVIKDLKIIAHSLIRK